MNLRAGHHGHPAGVRTPPWAEPTAWTSIHGDRAQIRVNVQTLLDDPTLRPRRR